MPGKAQYDQPIISTHVSYEQRRQHTQAMLRENAGDKSRAGGVDEPIRDLVALVNTLPDVYTTSSCSGRISVFADASAQTRAQGKKGGQWIYVTHGLADLSEVLQALHSYCGQANGQALSPAVFRFEPFILAVEARDMQAAQAFLQTARQAGFRESGATASGAPPQRVMVGVRCSIRLEVPLMFGQSPKLAVSEEYMCSLIDQANGKMHRNWARVQRFHDLLAQPAAHLSSAQPSAGRAHPDTGAGDSGQCCPDREPHVPPQGRAVQSEQAKAVHADVSKLQSAVQEYSEQHDEQSGARLQPSIQNMSMAGATKRQHAGLKASVVRRLRALDRRQKEVLTRVAALEDTLPGPEAADRALCWQRMLLSLEGSLTAESLMRWGHSMVQHTSTLLVFGGYGGADAHKRLGNLVAVDTSTGAARLVDPSGSSPEPRIGHAAAVLGNTMVVHGGRTAPDQALADVWALDLPNSSGSNLAWRRLKPSAAQPAARHRHSAIVAHSQAQECSMVIFGGCALGAAFGDVWRLRIQAGQAQWKQLQTNGGGPGPRYSHAAAILGTTMYIHGGRRADNAVLGDLWALDLDTMAWTCLETRGASVPPALFSHSLTAVGEHRLLLLGGCPEQESGDSYLYDTRCLAWSRATAALFSSAKLVAVRHAACVVGNTLFVLGGGAMCFSFGSTFSEPLALDLEQLETIVPHGSGCAASKSSRTARQGAILGSRYEAANTVYYSKVCSTAISIGADWQHSVNVERPHSAGPTPTKAEVRIGKHAPISTNACPGSGTLQIGPAFSSSTNSANAKDSSIAMSAPAQCGSQLTAGSDSVTGGTRVLQVQKRHAKTAKDALKALGFLDRHGRVIQADRSAAEVALPLTPIGAEHIQAIACSLSHSSSDSDNRTYDRASGEASRAAKDACSNGPCDPGNTQLDSPTVPALLCSSESAHTAALQTERSVLTDILKKSLGRVAEGEVAARSGLIAPADALQAAVLRLLVSKGHPDEAVKALRAQIPCKWERLGDIALLPNQSFASPVWASLGSELWEAVAAALGVARLARQSSVANTGTRDSKAVLLKGKTGWVEHRENGILYCLDVTRCMFSSGNVTEKARMGRLACCGETVVDFFAGIGYYTLPLLVHAGARHVYACEWNPAAVQALKHNLARNGVAARCTVLEGDCTAVAPQGIADRVLLGLLPSSECAWKTAVAALKDTGGRLHLHSNVKDTEEASWAHAALDKLSVAATELGRRFTFTLERTERVKWYAPHIRHVVLDICGSATSAPATMPAQPVRRAAAVLSAEGVRTLPVSATDSFWRDTVPAMEPAILQGCDFGPASERWTAEYIQTLPSSQSTAVSVHVCPATSGCMDIVRKNFCYVSMSLAELVGHCADPGAYTPVVASGERYYLRSLGSNPRKEPSDLRLAFPALAADLCLPQLPDPEAFFSSVLRISSGGLRLWTHFDVMSNVLCQIRGTKHIRLWPPSEEAKLYMSGSSSEVMDIAHPDRAQYPLYQEAKHMDCILQPGDLLYIPSLWLHSVLSEDFSISVNVFWRDLPASAYPSKDLYGNADPLAAAAAAAHIQKAIQQLGKLPEHFRTFYGSRCLRQLSRACN